MGTDGITAVEKPSRTWPLTLPEQSPLQESVHEQHWDDRRKVILALEDGYGRHCKRAAQALASCSQGASFFVDPSTGKVRPWVNRCHHRMCFFCGVARSAKVAEQILLVMNRFPEPRMIVLTVKSEDLPLRDQITKLLRHFRKLRRTKLWRELVTGGVYTMEVTRNAKTGLWHPHLNAIIGGGYFPQKQLRKLWHDVTGSAEIVWIQKVKDRAGAARELAKYIGKPYQCTEWPAVAIRDYAWAVNGARMVQTFGNVYGLKVQDRDVDEEQSADVYRVKISRLIYLARRGAKTPQKLLVLISERWPQFRSYIYHQIPRLEKPKGAGDQMRRLQHLLHPGTPPARAPPSSKAAHDKQDTAIFTAFCRFRADDMAGTFTDLDYS